MNPYILAFLYTWSNSKFKEIRILSMSVKYEFPNMTYEEIHDEYEVNPETDLISVCPNCHMILHSKIGGT